MKTFADANPTPEMQAAYDAAYKGASEHGWRYEPQPLTEETPTKEGVLLRTSAVWGQLAGLADWAKRHGIKTSLFS